MDERQEALSLIKYGCELSRQVESNLPHWIENPSHLLRPRCEDIVKTFNTVMVLLDSHSHNPSSSSPSSSSFPPIILGQSSELPRHELGVAGVQDLLRGTLAQPMDLLHELGAGVSCRSEMSMLEALELGLEVPAGSSRRPLELELGGMLGGYVKSGDAESFQGLVPSGDVQDMVMEESDCNRSPSNRPRTRKKSRETRSVKVGAPLPRTGNAEIAPDDGHTWRKYGQKVILNSKFPRSYFRCAHRDWGCVAKRKVQRLDDEPHMLEVTYVGKHTCHTPPHPPPSSLSATRVGLDATQAPPSPSASIHFDSWFFRKFEVDQKDENAPDEGHVPVFGQQEVGESSNASAEPSHMRDASENDQALVENIANLFFNSDSSNNSMDSIFSPKGE